MKHVEVVAAIIQYQDKILCVQRGDGKFDYISRKFEFPGGKIEEGESQTEALRREILEELNMPITIGSHFMTVEHAYPDFAISMHSFLCETHNTALKLIDHIDYKWLIKSELPTLDWAAADIPIVKKLMEV
jgi:8-oxo-dGTP diphosphatase